MYDLADSNPLERARKLRNQTRALRNFATEYSTGLQCWYWTDYKSVCESNRLETELQRVEMEEYQ